MWWKCAEASAGSRIAPGSATGEFRIGDRESCWFGLCREQAEMIVCVWICGTFGGLAQTTGAWGYRSAEDSGPTHFFNDLREGSP